MPEFVFCIVLAGLALVASRWVYNRGKNHGRGIPLGISDLEPDVRYGTLPIAGEPHLYLEHPDGNRLFRLGLDEVRIVDKAGREIGTFLGMTVPVLVYGGQQEGSSKAILVDASK